MIRIAELLTVSISETYKDNYKVIVYDKQDQNFKALEIKEWDFHLSDGRCSWDLFAVTNAELTQGSGEFYKPMGEAIVSRHLNKKEMKEFFLKKKISAKRFFRGTSRYGVISVDRILRLHKPEEKNGKLAQYIDFQSGGEDYRNKLNKDYRWLTYWANNQQAIDQKIAFWKDYLNKPNREVYCVLNRHYFKNGYGTWIVGFHCL